MGPFETLPGLGESRAMSTGAAPFPGMVFPRSLGPAGAEAAEPRALLLLSPKIPTFLPKGGRDFSAFKILGSSNGKFHKSQGRKPEELSSTKGVSLCSTNATPSF